MASTPVGYARAGVNAEPSPSIWDNCPLDALRVDGEGYFIHEDFLGGTEVFADGGPIGGNNQLTLDGDTSTIPHKAAEVGGYQSLVTGANDNDALAMYTQPLDAIVLNSGRRMWFEVRLEVNAAAFSDIAVFAGLAAESILSRDIVADDAATHTSVAANSLMGFVMTANNQDDFQFIIKKDTDTALLISADVNNSTALGTGAARIALLTERKLGMYFNGKDTLSIFVDGVLVAKQVLTSTHIGTDTFAAIVSVKATAAAAKTLTVDWVRVAMEVRP